MTTVIEQKEESGKEEKPEASTFEKRPPAYSNEGCQVWINIDKKGREYLTIRLMGHNPIRAWKK